jgi:hypothetical protein
LHKKNGAKSRAAGRITTTAQSKPLLAQPRIGFSDYDAFRCGFIARDTWTGTLMPRITCRKDQWLPVSTLASLADGRQSRTGITLPDIGRWVPAMTDQSKFNQPNNSK